MYIVANGEGDEMTWLIPYSGLPDHRQRANFIVTTKQVFLNDKFWFSSVWFINYNVCYIRTQYVNENATLR